MPEVAGDAAVLIDPESVDSITAALETLLSDASFRGKLSTKALLQASKFNWRNTAEQTYAIYRKAAARIDPGRFPVDAPPAKVS